MITSTIARTSQFAVSGTNIFDQAESLVADYNEQGGLSAVTDYFNREDVVAGLGEKTSQEAIAEVVSVIVTAQALISLRDAGHGTNLAPLR